MLRKLTTLLALLSLSALLQAQTDQCTQNNYTLTPAIFTQTNQLEHISGFHQFSQISSGSCLYAQSSRTACRVTATAAATPNMQEAPGSQLTDIFFAHVPTVNQQNGRGTATSGSITATAFGAGAVVSCVIGFCGSGATITITPVPGVGFSASFSQTTLWTDSLNFVNECGAETPGIITPIVIDAYGEGFHLTSADNGVTFDILADGNPLQISWTDPAYHNGWLALDRNGDGKITSGAELFGNVTPQPDNHRPPNGYLALAMFDTPQYGGNGDGIIDANDAVFSKLRVWIDANHDGISQPEELHTLPELGIQSLALKYHLGDYEDAYGNHFRYQSFVNDPKDRKDYDVLLVKK